MQEIGIDVQGARVSRSFLFVPADSERKLEKAADSNADALIIDLEDSVASAERPTALKSASASSVSSAFMRTHRFRSW